MTSARSIIALLVVALAGTTNAYSTPKPIQKLTQSTSSRTINRGTFLATTTSACLTFLTSQPAFAKDVDPAKKGTKSDPEYQGCLSKCVYECTKPKGMEQKTRGECIPQCKKECATTKQQLLVGEPIKN